MRCVKKLNLQLMLSYELARASIFYALICPPCILTMSMSIVRRRVFVKRYQTSQSLLGVAAVHHFLQLPTWFNHYLKCWA
jgi:hypothetical protein